MSAGDDARADVELTEAERDLLVVATALFGWAIHDEAMEATEKAVVQILADRLRTVEIDRDETEQAFALRFNALATKWKAAEDALEHVRALPDEWERLAAGNEAARGKATRVAGYYRRVAAQLRKALEAESRELAD